MKHKNLIILIVIIVIIGIWLAVSDRSPQTISDGTNSEMMDARSDVPVMAQDLAYFPGATGYYAQPIEDGRYPGIVMIHENRGLRPEIKDAAKALAKEGYRVLAVDLFGGKTAEDQTGARALTSGFDQAQAIDNLRAAADYLRAHGSDKVASLGWCFGGRQSVELAISGEPLDATVVYYGGGMATSTDRLFPISWPVLGIFGDQDQAIPVSMVRDFESSLETLGVSHEIHIYPGVGHAFANPSGANYAPEATKDAWEKTLRFLAENLH